MRGISTTFAEGRYFDLWMVVHFLVGVSGGFSNVLFGLDTLAVFGVGIAIMVLWEIGEYVAGIREGPMNRVLDVAVGTAGVALALLTASPFGLGVQRALFGLSLLLVLGGSALGWRAYRRRR